MRSFPRKFIGNLGCNKEKKSLCVPRNMRVFVGDYLI